MDVLFGRHHYYRIGAYDWLVAPIRDTYSTLGVTSRKSKHNMLGGYDLCWKIDVKIAFWLTESATFLGSFSNGNESNYGPIKSGIH